MKIILFDIDGTLMRVHGAGTRAQTRAGQAVFGPEFTLNGVNTNGALDSVIFTEAARLMGVADPEPLHTAFQEHTTYESSRPNWEKLSAVPSCYPA